MLDQAYYIKFKSPPELVTATLEVIKPVRTSGKLKKWR
jgi:hypothetical protein